MEKWLEVFEIGWLVMFGNGGVLFMGILSMLIVNMGGGNMGNVLMMNGGM